MYEKTIYMSNRMNFFFVYEGKVTAKSGRFQEISQILL